ncbi:hypothetical protein [Actinocrispum wychmicini]|uniref:DUF4304 domain-containing protein n=1 Tax=Actinocrispum wychmicini TaxID=1213861 RepID=A0A4V2S6D5_9PSEU|nr:hypothetical protein [Actinocrispum wychmicini]TCO55680.1 hypothetical protein EV192_107102 [Actinocrispum wychmicini]
MLVTTKLLDDLLGKYVTPVLTRSGFRRSHRRFLLGQAPGNLVLVQFRRHQLPNEVAFFFEWSVIPAAECDFQNRGQGRPSQPSTTWGIISNRVRVPIEIAPTVDIEAISQGMHISDEIAARMRSSTSSTWAFPVEEGIDRFGAAIEGLLTTGGLIAQWQAMTDREYVLELFEQGQARSTLAVSASVGWPQRYVAMYIDDGDWNILEAMLRTCEAEIFGGAWTEWWRKRLTARRADSGGHHPPRSKVVDDLPG